MKFNSYKIRLLTFTIILLSLILAAYQFVESAPPNEITIATGKEGGGYYKFASVYQEQLAKQQFTLRIQPTSGSVETLKLLKEGLVDAGFVQGGIGQYKLKPEGLQAVASLFYEPLWVFYRREQPIENLLDLRGKRVAVGEIGSGTMPMATQLLYDNNIHQGNTDFLYLSSTQALEKIQSHEVDAAFFVMSPSSPVIAKLLAQPDIKLLNFRRAAAYASHYPFLTTVTLGEGMIDLVNDLPQQDTILLAATASLVVREDLHPDVIHLLLTTAIDIHKEGGILEKKDQFPSTQFVEFPLNPSAQQLIQHGPTWLHRVFPFWIASTLDHLKILLVPLVIIILLLIKRVLSLYPKSLDRNH